METKRVCIFPKDVQRITGKSDRYGRALVAQIKKHYNKADHQLITIDEFCQYTGLKAEIVRPFLVG